MSKTLNRLNILSFYSVGITLLLLVMAVSANARQLTPQQALARLQQNMAGAKGTAYSSDESFPTEASSLLYTDTTSTGKATLYVFANADNDGFSILGADDLAPAVLGYCTSGLDANGQFNMEQLPDGFRYWMSLYSKQISNAIATGKEVQVTSINKSAITPLISSQWNQGQPYNNLCPAIAVDGAPGGRAVTGCVATAMAQVLAYWSQRSTMSAPKGIGHWTCPLGLDEKYKDEDLSYYNLDWEALFKKNSSNTDWADAVATLSYVCGATVYMSYGAESGANFNLTSFRNNFGMDRGVKVEYRTDSQGSILYTDDDWAQLIYNELSNKRPVLYSGFASEGGHAFICDGYRYRNFTDQFHFNWGWGGAADGYFTIASDAKEALNPQNEEVGYIYGQEIITNLKANEGGALGINLHATNQHSILRESNYVSQRDTISQGTTLNMSFNDGYVYSLTGEEITVVMGAKFVSYPVTATSKVYYANAIDKHTFGDYLYNYDFSTNNIPAGKYYVYPAVMNPEDNNWYDVYLPSWFSGCCVNVKKNVKLLVYDVNDDGKEDAADVTTLTNYIFDNTVKINKLKADINMDGNIDIVDLQQLQNQIK